MDLQLSRVKDAQEWNKFLLKDLNGHFLQSWQWGQFKERFGWQADRLIWINDQGQPKAAALILKRFLTSRFSILYCPRGPSLDWSDEDLRSSVLSDLQKYITSDEAFFLKIDPDIALGSGQPDTPDAIHDPIGEQLIGHLKRLNWRPSKEQIQFRNSMHLDLHPSEDDLLARMKQKTRYNIRLAQRRGVTVRRGDPEDLDLLYHLYAETSLRDRFTIRDQDYYHEAWGSFMKAGMAQPFIAEVDGEPVAGIIVFHFGKRAIYMYGMSRDVHREKMPNHLLQWEAIKWAKTLGYTTYDFWGAPDTFSEEDPMWGVYRFKLGFGAKVSRTIGAWDYVSRPMFYLIYTLILPRILALMRVRGRTKTIRSLD